MEIALTALTSVEDADAELVRRMAGGEEEGLRLLYAKYGRRLFAYALRLTRRQGVAEEVLQDSLLAAWRGARGFRGQGRVIAWLLGIVHRQGLNATRRKQLPTDPLDEAVDTPDRERDPAEQAERSDRRRVLARALDELSVDHRTALELVFYQGLSLAEVARVCDCPVGTVKSRLSYARASLRGALARAGLKEEDLL
jgi:RNA polymerase sigma-70 factor (ECF subfamily)